MRADRKKRSPQREMERQHFDQFFKAKIFNQRKVTKEEAVADFYSKFMYQLEKDKKEIEIRIRNEVLEK